MFLQGYEYVPFANRLLFGAVKQLKKLLYGSLINLCSTSIWSRPFCHNRCLRGLPCFNLLGSLPSFSNSFGFCSCGCSSLVCFRHRQLCYLTTSIGSGVFCTHYCKSTCICHVVLKVLLSVLFILLLLRKSILLFLLTLLLFQHSFFFFLRHSIL